MRISAKSDYAVRAMAQLADEPKREPVKWDPGQPYRGLGYREVEAEAEPVAYRITELPVIKA